MATGLFRRRRTAAQISAGAFSPWWVKIRSITPDTRLATLSAVYPIEAEAVLNGDLFGVV